jgi:hypothetical protein
METIQVVVDSKLLQATDRAARRTKLNRSALIRAALREHLGRLETRELEERDRKGYEMGRQRGDDLSGWESEAAWPSFVRVFSRCSWDCFPDRRLPSPELKPNPLPHTRDLRNTRSPRLRKPDRF